jgi:hypothetical protein
MRQLTRVIAAGTDSEARQQHLCLQLQILLWQLSHP